MKKTKQASDEDEYSADDPEEVEGASDEEEQGAEDSAKKRPQRSAKKRQHNEDEEDEDEEDDEEEEDEEEEESDSDPEQKPKKKRRSKKEEEDEEDSEDNGFDNASAFPPKDYTSGAFVVAKADMGKNTDPTLWRIDGKALLQKYLPFKEEGKTLYKSTSTYSGWSVNNKEKYLAAQVTFKVQNRSETIVELNLDAQAEEVVKEEKED